MIVTFHNNRKDLQVTIMCVSKLQSFSLIIMTNPKGKNKKENAAIKHPIQSAKLLHIIILFSMPLYAMFRESYNIITHRLVSYNQITEAQKMLLAVTEQCLLDVANIPLRVIGNQM